MNTEACTPTVPGSVSALSTDLVFRVSRTPMRFETSGRDSDAAVVATRARECGQFLASVHDVGAYAAPVTSIAHPSVILATVTDADVDAIIEGMGW